MSTILDALRKSEQERKLNRLPTLTDMAAPKEPSRWPFYIGVALVLLALAVAVLAYAIWNGKSLPFQEPSSAQSIDRPQSLDSGEANAQSLADASDTAVVNVVSYSDDPALRFAMVNGKMVREGEFIEPGLKVEEILSNAVVFNARGKKLTLSP